MRKLLADLREQVRMLDLLARLKASTDRQLSELIESGAAMDPSSRAAIGALLKRYEELLKQIGVVTERRLVRSDPEDSWGQLPAVLRESYLILHETAYGTRALRINDSTRAKVSRQSVTSDGQTRHIGPPAASRSSTSSKRNVIMDQAAWEFKRKMDAKLHRLADQIRQWNTTRQDPKRGFVLCRECSRVLDSTWKFCANCGKRRVI